MRVSIFVITTIFGTGTIIASIVAIVIDVSDEVSNNIIIAGFVVAFIFLDICITTIIIAVVDV